MVDRSYWYINSPQSLLHASCNSKGLRECVIYCVLDIPKCFSATLLALPIRLWLFTEIQMLWILLSARDTMEDGISKFW